MFRITHRAESVRFRPVRSFRCDPQAVLYTSIDISRRNCWNTANFISIPHRTSWFEVPETRADHVIREHDTDNIKFPLSSTLCYTMISPSDYTNDLPRPTGPVKTIRLDSDDNVFIADAISFLTGETIDESNRTLRSILSQDYDIEISEVNERAPDGNFFKHPICEGIVEICFIGECVF